MANVARYHRRALPKKSHEAYKRLSKNQRKVVAQLASFLRLAEGLDRSQYQNVVDLKVVVDAERLSITIETRGDPELELWATRRAVDLFEATFQRSVVVEAAWSPGGSGDAKH